MPDRFSYTEPQLCHYSFDLSRDWFVYFDFTDHLTGSTTRKQYRGGINYAKSKDERITQGNALKAFWKQQLKAGWNPFVKSSDLPITKPTILEAFETILQLKMSSCGDRTIQTYKHSCKLLRTWLEQNRMGAIYLHQFDSTHARAYMDHLTIKKGYSGRTFNDQLTVLSTFFNCMIEREWVTKNPFKKVKKLQVEIGRNIAYTEQEKEALKQYLKEHDRNMYYFTQFIYYCFIRRSELTRLKIGNIDFANMTIVIPSAASKNKKQESVVIPNSFVPVLKEMNLHKYPQHWYIFGRKLEPGAIQYKNYNHISSRHNKISLSLGIDQQKGLYSWKHSGVCALYPVLNGDVYALMRQLRHSELTTTQIYLKSLGLTDNSAIRSAVW